MMEIKPMSNKRTRPTWEREDYDDRGSNTRERKTIIEHVVENITEGSEGDQHLSQDDRAPGIISAFFNMF